MKKYNRDMINYKKNINALISVSNTKNIEEFAKSLIIRNVKLFATTGTASVLKNKGIHVTEISNYTNFPEIMNGRIKTLHHKIYASILRRPEQDKEVMKKHHIIPIDIVIVNFYEINKTLIYNLDFKDVIEYIDIGGPAMVRAAAKNYINVAVITQPCLYQSILKEMDENYNNITNQTKFNLALLAFEYIKNYDEIIYNYFLKQKNTTNDIKPKKNLPLSFTLNLIKKQDLCYGENKQQQAAWYKHCSTNTSNNESIKQIQGKTLSYNNLSDINAAISCIEEFKKCTCIIIKHGNPCGAATSKNNDLAYLFAYNSDPVSAFGGIICFNNMLNETTAKNIIEKQFVEIIIAPDFTESSKKIFKKKPNIRIITYKNSHKLSSSNFDIKSIYDGMLIQTHMNNNVINKNTWSVVSKAIPNESDINDSEFALKIVKHLKSNAIVFVKNNKTISIGSGQTSRVDAIKLAINKAKYNNISLNKTIVASDAFFPFSDSIDLLSKYKTTCIIQPGGSIRDNEIIKSVNKYNIAMIFTNQRYFKH